MKKQPDHIQFIVGICIPFAVYGLATLLALIAGNQPKVSGAADYTYYYVMLYLAIATGVLAILAIVSLVIKRPWMALGIAVIIAIPLLVAGGCFAAFQLFG